MSPISLREANFLAGYKREELITLDITITIEASSKLTIIVIISGIVSAVPAVTAILEEKIRRAYVAVIILDFHRLH
jgi:hypothetical protein